MRVPGAMVLSFANATKSGFVISQRGNELRAPCRIVGYTRRARVAKLSPSRVTVVPGSAKRLVIRKCDGCGSGFAPARLAREVPGIQSNTCVALVDGTHPTVNVTRTLGADTGAQLASLIVRFRTSVIVRSEFSPAPVRCLQGHQPKPPHPAWPDRWVRRRCARPAAPVERTSDEGWRWREASQEQAPCKMAHPAKDGPTGSRGHRIILCVLLAALGRDVALPASRSAWRCSSFMKTVSFAAFCRACHWPDRFRGCRNHPRA